MIRLLTNASFTQFISLAAATFAMAVSPGIYADDVVGSDGGSISVDNSGQAAWTMPLDVPSGINGVAPNLTLSVSTGGGNGTLGVGGGLSGLSAISRCGKSLHQDGYFEAPQFVKEDAYCLDGSRLLLETGTYGESGSTYRTAIESFQRIKAVGAVGDTGPSFFEVTNRAGAKTYYGSFEDRNTFESDPVSGAKSVWKVDYLEDSNGNRLKYEYSDVGTEEIQLTSIYYGYNPSQGANAGLRVSLEYESRPDTSQAYSRGALYSQTKRVSNIKTFVGSSMVRDYRLGYEQGAVTQASRIVSVQECSANDQCYRPSILRYAPETETNWRTSNATLPVALQSTDKKPYGTLVDINNDGKVDVVQAYRDGETSYTISTWLGQTSGWVQSAEFQLPSILYDYHLAEDGMIKGQLLDVNGDGWLDYVKAFKTPTKTTLRVYRNTGSGFETVPTTDFPVPFQEIDVDGKVRSLAEVIDLNSDGLVDVVQSYKLATGAVEQVAWINTLATGVDGWAVSADYQPKSLLTDYTLGEEGRVLASMQDVNADGLVDWVESYQVDGIITNNTWLNTGRGWAASADYTLPNTVAVFNYDINKGVAAYSFSDVNGDGLPDLLKSLWENGNQQHDAWIHTGLGWQQDAAYHLPAAMTSSWQNGNTVTIGGLIDLNSDGHPDFMRSFTQNGESYEQIWLFNKDTKTWSVDSSGDYAMPFINYVVESDGKSSAQAELADLDHDGYPELFNLSTGEMYTSAPNIGSHYPGTLIETQDSFESATKLYYGITTDESIYTPSAYSAYPNVAYNAPTRVITKVTASNGVGGEVVAHHTYGGAKANAAGLGGLGYAFHGMRDGSSDVELMTHFHQTYPYAGKVKSSSKELNGTVLSLSTSEMTTKVISINDLETLHAYPYISVANTYDFLGRLIKTTRSQTEIDNFGNTISSTEETFSADTTDTFQGLGVSANNALAAQPVGSKLERKVETEVEFKAPDLANWIFGLPEKNTVTLTGFTEGQQEVYTNVSTATFFDDGKPKSETLEPNNPQQVTKSYTYDGFGNRETSSIETNDVAKRTTTTEFTDDGRFPKKVINNIGHAITTEFNQLVGKPNLITDPNGISKEILYDGFGTVLRETRTHQANGATRGRQIVLPKWCSDNTNSSINCPQYAQYFIAALDDEGEAPEISYFDRNGKELRKQTYGFNGEIIVVDRTYDSEGRVRTASQPYFRDKEQPFVTLYHYDELGREVERVNAENKRFNTAYDGLTVTVTNPGNNDTGTQVSKVVNNIFGQPIESHDALGSVTKYVYDGRGKLVKTIDSKGNIATITYDPVFGRKVSMDDPDIGKLNYEYDSLGNVWMQTDAKGQKTKMVYDNLNRLVERTDDFDGVNPEVTTWTYSNEKVAGKIKGGLEKVESTNLTRTVQYDMFGRVAQATSVIDGQTFTQRTGYNGTADKLDWVEYPSGLTVRSTYDDYGFPATVEGLTLNRGRYGEFQDASRDLIGLQRDFERWKDQNLSLAQLAELENHEREVRRLGKYLADFYDGFEDNAQKQGHQDVAQRYIDLVERVQAKITQHQNWLSIYQAKADVIQNRLRPQIERQDELLPEYNRLDKLITEERSRFDNRYKKDHDNYAAKAKSYADQLNRIGTEINQNIATIRNIEPHAKANLDTIHHYMRVLFIPRIADIYIRHPEQFARDTGNDANLGYVLNHYMNNISQHQISHGFQQIANHATDLENRTNNIEAAQARITALEKKAVDQKLQWWYDHWETRRKGEERKLIASGKIITDLNNQIKPIVDELNVIGTRTEPDHLRLTNWLVPIIESHNNVILSFNDRARGYVNQISANTGTFVKREDIKWENFLKPFFNHANYAQCLTNKANTPGHCYATHLVHVYNDDGSVNTAKQTAERSKVDERRMVDVRSFWNNQRFFCAQNYGYSCPSTFRPEIERLTKTLHINQCARLTDNERIEHDKAVEKSNSVIPCDTALWGKTYDRVVDGVTTARPYYPYLDASIAKITSGNLAAFRTAAINKHKAKIETLVTAATRNTYNAETSYDDIVNNRVWSANPGADQNTKPQSREQKCVSWAPSATSGNQPACMAYANREEDSGSDSDPGEFVLIRKGNVQNLTYNSMDAAARLANSTLKSHQQSIERILNAAQANTYASRYLAIQDKSSEVTRLYNEIDRAYENADYIDDYDANKKIYWQAEAINSKGQVEKARYGNGVDTTYAYDQFGRIRSVHTKNGSAGILNKTYQYDALGNLISRHDIIEDVRETFNYDGLNRLTQVNYAGTGSDFASSIGQSVVNYSYDELGNIIHKSDIMNTGEQYRYGETAGTEHAGPHAVTSIPGMGDFRYDKNGNQTFGRGRAVSYNAFNKPDLITHQGRNTQMRYGPERQMVWQLEDQKDGGQQKTIFVGGAFEQVTEVAGGVTNRHHITVAGNAIAIVDTKPGSLAPVKESYLHKNHQSSVLAITDASGAVVEKRYFDAFGDIKGYIGKAAGYLENFINDSSITPLSFTGHRWLAAAGVVHMKGRVYDPVIGRFLSADPHIQAPLNSQSLNRYAYVLNNPLSLTDPSGYFFSKIFKALKKLFAALKKIIKAVLKAIKKVVKSIGKVLKKIGKFIKKYYKVIIAVVVAVVVSVVTYGAASGASWGLVSSSIAAGAAGGAASGLIMTGSLKGALQGALFGAVTGGIAAGLSGIGQGIAQGLGYAKDGLVAGALNASLSGGVISKLQGGSFSKGIKNGLIGFVAFAAIGSVGFVKRGLQKLNDFGRSLTTKSQLEEVVLKGAWEEPELNSETQPDTVTKKQRQKMYDESPYEEGSFNRKEVKSILKDKVFDSEADKIWEASVDNNREMGALRVYELDGDYHVYSVGRPNPYKSNGIVDLGLPDPNMGRHVFDWHPHPWASPTPSPADLSWSYRTSAPGVIRYSRTRNSLYIGACKPGFTC